MPDLPTGTVTFLFTDIEGSTRLWEQHPEAMRYALARHNVLLHHAIEAQGGFVFKTVGAAYYAVFAMAWQALLASREVEADGDESGAMTIVTERGFGTVSSSLIALPAVGTERKRPIWLYAAGRPDQMRYEPVKLAD